VALLSRWVSTKKKYCRIVDSRELPISNRHMVRHYAYEAIERFWDGAPALVGTEAGCCAGHPLSAQKFGLRPGSAKWARDATKFQAQRKGES